MNTYEPRYTKRMLKEGCLVHFDNQDHDFNGPEVEPEYGTMAYLVNASHAPFRAYVDGSEVARRRTYKAMRLYYDKIAERRGFTVTSIAAPERLDFDAVGPTG